MIGIDKYSVGLGGDSVALGSIQCESWFSPWESVGAWGSWWDSLGLISTHLGLGGTRWGLSSTR